jgi:sulfate adenylyltransferase
MTARPRVAPPRGADEADAPSPPQWTPPSIALDDLEMLLLGAYKPLTGFLGKEDATRVAEEGRLGDGTPWPLRLILEVPPLIAAEAGTVQLADEEGAPIAEVTVTEVWTLPTGEHAVAGPVRPLGPVSRGAYPALRRTADADVRSDRPIVAVPLTHAPDHDFIAVIRSRATELGEDVMLMPLVGANRSSDLDASALVRAALTVQRIVGRGTQVVPLPLPERDDADVEARLLRHVAANYGAKDVMHQPLAIDNARRDVSQGGVAILFTGLSGSGKSTIARALHEALLERTDRTVTMLDGDIVRRMLSSELGFSREHRELNVRRIGYVAAEVARHGGIAIAAPIAPYESTRAEFRAMVEALGQLLLVHVNTPLEECERRDRKGLYARARAGLITEFTGISDPYEVPDNADLRIDTSTVSVEAAVEQIVTALTSRNLIRLASQ